MILDQVLPFCLRARFFSICEVVTGFAMLFDLLDPFGRRRCRSCSKWGRLPVRCEIH